jgi:outer membrane protein assembly factor BamD
MHLLRPSAPCRCQPGSRRRTPLRTLRTTALPIAVGCCVLATAACRHGGQADIATLASGSDTKLWNSASRDYEKKRYETARQYAQRLIEGFPNSQHQPLARLVVADSYFKEGGSGNLVMAAAAYREFTTLFPSHPRADYAQFQVAECYFKERHRPDRDQSSTEDALREFDRFLELHPNSPLADQARERATRCKWSLARAEFLVGYFYQRGPKSYRAAIQRYQGILTQFPDYAATDEVLYRLSQCLAISGRTSEALPYLARLIDSYPDSSFKAGAKRLQTQLLAAPTPSATPPAVSPAPSSPPPPPRPE